MTLDVFDILPKPLTQKDEQSGSLITSGSTWQMHRESAAMYMAMRTAKSFYAPDLEHAYFASTTSLNSFTDFQIPDDSTSPGPSVSFPWICKDYVQAGRGSIAIRGIVYLPNIANAGLRIRATTETLFDSTTSETAETTTLVGQVPPSALTPWGRTGQDLLATSFALNIRPNLPSSRRIRITLAASFVSNINPYGSTVTRKAYIQQLLIMGIPEAPAP